MTRRSQAGFTLVELMISLVLFSFAIAGVLAVAVSMSQGFREQRASMGAEGAVRIPLDFIGDALRQASPGSPTGDIQDAGTCTGKAFAVSNFQSSVNPPTVTGWDRLELIFASGAVVTSTLTVYDGSSNTLQVNDASQLVPGDSVVISNTAQGHLFKITAVAGNILTLAPPCVGYIPPINGGKYSAGSLVIRAMHAVFTIDSIDTIPTLMMDPDENGPAVPEPLAEGVEDMQIAIGVDKDGNGAINRLPTAPGPPWEDASTADADEWLGNNAGDNLTITPPQVVRAVRITLIARTTTGTVGNAATFLRPAAEDHAVGTIPDKFRRRVLRSTVEIRNMAGSP